MATEQNSATLQTNLNTAVTSQTSPDAITPITLGNQLADQEVSAFNKVDGIEVGVHGRDLTVPDVFTSTVDPNGQTMEEVIDALMAQINQDHISITGGVQGRQGEFLANVTSDTNQTILISETSTPADTYRLAAVIKFPNDKDNGSFDNGNNFLVNKFVTPSGGQASVKFDGAGIALKLLQNDLSGRTRTIQILIRKNGTSTLASSNEIALTTADAVNSICYFNDMDTGTIATSADDEITVELWEKINASGGSPEDIRLQVMNGFFNNELI